jgi:long-chain acyl-CoA synthetase
VEFRVVDENGADVAADEVGEIVVRRTTGMLGYWRNPEQTRETIRDGWIHTGDLARIDADRYITLVDRKRDVIISAGENIYPKEIEDALAAHPGVLQVAVVGSPDPRPDATVEAEDLDAWCLERLARYKRPRRWTFVESLPMTATGKVQKNVLRQQLRQAGGAA